MKISISGKGIHRREVPGIEKMRTLPSHWYAFTNLELVDAGAMPKQIDVILVLEDRILIVDLKDWSGKITSDGDRWFQNDRAVDTSPVRKILENARIMAGLLGRFLTKAAAGRGRKFNRWEIPLIEGCVVVTGRGDIRSLPDMEKPRVFHIDDFCRFMQDPRERASRLATPTWIDKAEPYTNPASRWRGDLARFFGTSEGYFKPLDKRYGDYKAISDHTYQHPKLIYSEYDAEEVSISHGFGLLRLWDFSNAEPRYASEEARTEIAGREQNVITYLIDRQPDLESVLLRPKAADPDKGIHYWEVFERRRQLRRLREFLVSHSEELTTAIRIDLARTLVSHVAAMHRIGAAHLDIGDHSVWMELPSVIRISHLVAASYQELASLGDRRFEFLASGTVLPESIIEQEVDHYRKDVFLLGVVVHSIIFGQAPNVSNPGEPPAWNSNIDTSDSLAHLHGWFEQSLDVSSAARFANAQEMLDSFNLFVRENDRGPNATERLLRFRRWKSVRELYKQYPDEVVLKETDRIVAWTSAADGRTVLVKTWRRSCWGDELLESPRLARFCESAEDLILAEHAGIVPIIDVGYLGDHLVLIQEFVDAKDLAATLTSDLVKWRDPKFAAHFLLNLTKIVIDLHERGFTHGDLKPSNILVIYENDSARPLLVDLLDFGPASEGEIRTAAYSPVYEVGTKERDRYAVLRIAEELFEGITLDSSSQELLASAIRTCRETEPVLATLTPLLDALEELENPAVPERVPHLTISFPGLQYYIWLQKPHQFTITGNGQELVVYLNPSGKRNVVDIRRKIIPQSLVSLAEKRCTMRLVAEIEVAPEGRDVSDLSELIDKLLPKSADTDTSIVESDTVEPVHAAPVIVLDEDVVVEGSYQVSVPEHLNVPDLWQTLLQVEGEQFTRGIAEFDSSFSRERRRHTVVLQIRSGTLDFTREDRVLIELNTKSTTWVPIGILDLDLTRGKEIAVDASTFRARDGGLLCAAGSDLRFRSMMETDSRMRRTAATDRILRRGGVSPNLIDYFGWEPPEATDSGLVVDPAAIGLQYGLNASQSDAFVKIVSSRPLGLLQGPPGTGKTRFIAALVHYLLANGVISNVLLASQSHEAVNNATEGVLRLFRNGNVEPSLVRVGQEGSISEVLKPYHSAKVEAHYREKFRAGLKQRFEVVSQHIGLAKAFSHDLFLMESTVWPVFRQFQGSQTPGDQTTDTSQARYLSLRQTLLNLQETLGLALNSELDWHSPDAYESALSLLMKKHRVDSAEQVRRLKGVANLARDWMGSVTSRRRSFEEFLANTRHIVSGTCVGLGRAQLGLASARFDLVIVDEAARCTASELAVPIQAGKWILLVGDHLQLEPFHDPGILRETQRRLRIPMKDIVRSDFERSFASKYGKAVGQTLKTQYRMLPNIGRLVSEVFYNGGLTHGREDATVPESIWPDFLRHQLSWISTDNLGSQAYQVAQGGGGRSLSNPAEAAAIANVLRRLDDHPPFVEWLVSLSSDEQPIGIICTYAAQSQLIRQRLRAVGLSQTILNACKIDTVDSYQGKENVLVILSLVRNNEEGDSSGGVKAIAPGFMSRANRMNVALSRAMDKLVIVGAFQRWPIGGVMNNVTSTYQSLCDEQLATLVELSVSDADTSSVNKSKTKKKSVKKKQMKDSANNG
jgi:tRNA A-37 threonylcarbamoyl transferase component Bud32